MGRIDVAHVDNILRFLAEPLAQISGHLFFWRQHHYRSRTGESSPVTRRQGFKVSG